MEDSLWRLAAEIIDLYTQHRGDPNVPIEDVAGAVRGSGGARGPLLESARAVLLWPSRLPELPVEGRAMTLEHAKGMDVLREFTRTVLGRAKQDSQGFEHLVLTLAGAVATYHDPETIRAGTREGHHLSSCWFELNGTQYLLSYDQGVGRVRTGGKSGPVDFQLTETTTAQDVFAWFERKSPVPVVR